MTSGRMNDGRFIDFAAAELEKIGLIDRRDVIDGTLVRVPKAYPAYFGTYGEFDKLRAIWIICQSISDRRNGMHRYNNQDHRCWRQTARLMRSLKAGRTNRLFGKLTQSWNTTRNLTIQRWREARTYTAREDTPRNSSHELPRGNATEARTGVTSYRKSVYVACTLLALTANCLMGKDMAWDMLHYHVYAGFSAINNRLSQDYFAAGPQSYFNPYAYVPFYALIRSGLSAIAISSVLAAFHSAILWLTYELALFVSPTEEPRARLMVGVCAVTFAFVNPILLQQIGSSFADITTAELVLGGWVLLAGLVRTPQVWRLILAGLVLGIASALKLTNAVHAISALGVLMMLPLTLRGRFRFGVFYAVSLGVGFSIAAAPWSYGLFKIFGNPLFPLMNDVFRSPEFTIEPLRHFRFIPDNFIEALWRPFAIVDPVRMVHEELRAPDLRYAVIVVLFLAFFFVWLWSRLARSTSSPPAVGSALSVRVLTALSVGLVADWVIWLSSSGNGRYFLPMACVAAVVIVGLLFRLFSTQPKVRNYILAAIFGAQAFQLGMGTEFRWNAVPWGGRWLSVTVPESLQNDPSLYLSEGTQSNSFIAPYVAAGSGFINFDGAYSLGPAGANGARISALTNQYREHLRVLVAGDKIYENNEYSEPHRSQVDTPLERLGLHVDTSDCQTITVNSMQSVQDVAAEHSNLTQHPPGSATSLVTCRLAPKLDDHSAELTQQRAADIVLDRVEGCPKLFDSSSSYRTSRPRVGALLHQHGLVGMGQRRLG